MGDGGGFGSDRHTRPSLALDELTAFADPVDAVLRRDLQPGDRLIVATRNSVYSLIANQDGSFDASGGWFERESSGNARIEVRGCNAGGHAIFTNHVAARGLFMEFAGGLRTTRIQSVRRIPATAGADAS